MSADRIALSKFLSFVLRHKPDAVGLTLDEQGWASVDELIAKGNASGTLFDAVDLIDVVATSDKKRFTLSSDGSRIRAAQGHSVAIDLALEPSEPPAVLYHGTATKVRDAIIAEGLTPRSRQQVHLSSDRETAIKVGQRHGSPIVFSVDTAKMRARGLKFFRADNGVWLADVVPSDCLTLD